jgi:hypothetical protein
MLKGLHPAPSDRVQTYAERVGATAALIVVICFGLLAIGEPLWRIMRAIATSLRCLGPLFAVLVLQPVGLVVPRLLPHPWFFVCLSTTTCARPSANIPRPADGST